MCRKIIAVILLIAMSLCLFVGCRKDDNTDDGGDAPTVYEQPNFNYVTYESDGKTYLLNADTGETTCFFDGTDIDEIRMTNSGKRLFFSVDSSLYVWNVNSKDTPTLITDQLGDYNDAYSKGAFEITANGNEVIYTTKTGEKYDLYRSDLKSSQKLAEDICIWAMSNDGSRIICLRANEILNQDQVTVRIIYDAYFISKGGKTQLIAEGVSRASYGYGLPPTVVDDCSALVFTHPGTGYNGTYIWHADTQKTEYLFDCQVFHAISSTEIYYEAPAFGSDKDGNLTYGTLYYYDGKSSKLIAENVNHVYRIGEHYMSYLFYSEVASSLLWGIAYKGNSTNLGTSCYIAVANGHLPLYDETQETLYYNQEDPNDINSPRTLHKISIVDGKPQDEATNITDFKYTPRRGYGLCDGVFWHYASVNGKRALYRNGESVAEQYDEFAPVDKNSVAYTFEETLYFYVNGSTESIATNVVWLGKAFNGSVLYLTSDSSLYLYRNGKSTFVSDNVSYSSTSDIHVVLAQDERDHFWLALTHTSFDSDYFEGPFRGYT